ncbi:hypothetical protein IRJ41_024136, partial [Triplophysa rosa]
DFAKKELEWECTDWSCWMLIVVQTEVTAFDRCWDQPWTPRRSKAATMVDSVFCLAGESSKTSGQTLSRHHGRPKSFLLKTPAPSQQGPAEYPNADTQVHTHRQTYNPHACARLGLCHLLTEKKMTGANAVVLTLVVVMHQGQTHYLHPDLRFLLGRKMVWKRNEK